MGIVASVWWYSGCLPVVLGTFSSLVCRFVALGSGFKVKGSYSKFGELQASHTYSTLSGVGEVMSRFFEGIILAETLSDS